ncbi:hypothetical protein CspeluHIS016_0700010 [Cutaneotrichosporon spelunceum]|uniref:SnoaL-like domain-containing protein n=1 Tax=Cutaneotrichosporon spelunceum TaxID=1672016 RepID=A0AAD3YDC9_9TREE|nr:hypothetical protein CspeluHIS016_0700010 [Cutaneotrichosporon spelunceum]
MTNPTLQAFITDFYAKSDAHNKAGWVDCFTPDASLDLAGNKAKGSEGIGKICDGVWADLTRRQHTIKGVYVNPENADDVVVLGTIDQDRKDGVLIRGVEWGGRLQLKDGKIADYRVWIISAPKAG